jgi:hypothetical protein
VLWVIVKTLLASGPYAESSMRLWNNTLHQACARYPNLRIFDLASVVRDSRFISDGVHYTSTGYAARTWVIAAALANAFPRTARFGIQPVGSNAKPLVVCDIDRPGRAAARGSRR